VVGVVAMSRYGITVYFTATDKQQPAASVRDIVAVIMSALDSLSTEGDMAQVSIVREKDLSE